MFRHLYNWDWPHSDRATPSMCPLNTVQELPSQEGSPRLVSMLQLEPCPCVSLQPLQWGIRGASESHLALKTVPGPFILISGFWTGESSYAGRSVCLHLGSQSSDPLFIKTSASLSLALGCQTHTDKPAGKAPSGRGVPPSEGAALPMGLDLCRRCRTCPRGAFGTLCEQWF